jgi:tRNA 2-selenouridine synthase
MQNFDYFLDSKVPILDVRSPSEYRHGHIPGACNLPLFSDEERSIIGTLYKKEGKATAVKKGLSFAGPKLSFLVQEAEKLAHHTGKVRLYCARGGMRSSSVCWLLKTAGLDATTFTGGYKTFRNWVLSQFAKTYPFFVLGGLTGSGKTEILELLEKKEEAIIHLERLASHRGSSFGNLGFPMQPTTEHFENMLAYALFQHREKKVLWIEDESRMIGTCHLSPLIWKQMSASCFIWLNRSKKKRMEKLLTLYGHFPENLLIQATRRLTKKLGLQRTEEICKAIASGQIECALSFILDYYDQAYTYSCEKRHPHKIAIDVDSLDDDLIDRIKSIPLKHA